MFNIEKKTKKTKKTRQKQRFRYSSASSPKVFVLFVLYNVFQIIYINKGQPRNLGIKVLHLVSYQVLQIMYCLEPWICLKLKELSRYACQVIWALFVDLDQPHVGHNTLFEARVYQVRYILSRKWFASKCLTDLAFFTLILDFVFSVKYKKGARCVLFVFKH